MKHLHLINGKYAVRLVVPIALRKILGRPELRKWVGSDRKAAERAAPAIIADFYSRIDGAKAMFEAARPTLFTAAAAHYRSELKLDDQARFVAGQRTIVEQNKIFAVGRASRLRLMAAGEIDAPEMEALMGDAADQAIALGNVSPDFDRRRLLLALAEVQLEAMARVEDRDAGRIGTSSPKSEFLQPQPEPAVLEPLSRARSVVPASGETLSSMLVDFHAERTSGRGSMAPRTIKEHEVAVRMLEEFLGEGRAARNIFRTDLQDYKRALMKLPANYRQRFPGLTLPEAIVANSRRDAPYAPLNPQTINNKWLSHISSIMNWCYNEGLLTENPARGVRVDVGSGFVEPSRAKFDQDDLIKMFGSELFAKPAIYESRQWALLIALYTGARSSSEIRRIKLSDVYLEQGILVFDLIEATKNLHSKRLVPVHPTLLDLGLAGYLEKLRKAGRTLLFEDWEPEDKINRWFLRTYKRQVGVNDTKKVFHSFRNTLKTALARQGVNRDVSDLITGHKDQSVGGIYIDDPGTTMITAMSEALRRVDFELPISGLKPKLA